MISTSDIIYPKNFLTPESRVGKTFKYYKIEPFELKKEEPPKPEIHIGPGSYRIAFTQNAEKFFEDMPSDSLSAVIAVAMDMNASYNKLVTKHLPKAQIVYDRFHMQSQFGRDVLGVVRLDEARRLKAKKEILADISDDTDKETMKSLKQEAMLVITY